MRADVRSADSIVQLLLKYFKLRANEICDREHSYVDVGVEYGREGEKLERESDVFVAMERVMCCRKKRVVVLGECSIGC